MNIAQQEPVPDPAFAGPRLGFLGNVCNLFCDFTRRLRDEGRDAHLYHVRRFAQEDPFAAYGLPGDAAQWIHSRPYGGRFDTQTRPGAEMLQHLRSCASLHGQGPWLAWAQQADRPFIWQPYGSDFYAVPFARLRFSAPLRKTNARLLAANLSSALKDRVIAHRFRRTVASAQGIVITGWFDRHWIRGYRLLERLGRLPAIRTMPLPIDCKTFAPGAHKNVWPDPSLQARLDGFDSVCFYPSRQLFTTEGKLMDGMQASDPGKRNDLFYLALARVRAKGNNIGVVVIDKGDPDTPAAKAMIEKLGLADAVIWIPAMPRLRLIDWYRAADLVVDCFGGGAPGSISFEAMACGTPVMQWIDLDAGREWGLGWDAFYASVPPALNCRSVDHISAALEANSRPALRALGEQSRQWALANVDIDAGLRRLCELHRAIQ